MHDAGHPDPLGHADDGLTKAEETEWAEVERIRDLPDVDEALLNFKDDCTGDNAAMVVRAVMRAYGVTASLAGPSPRLSDEAIAAAWRRAYPTRATETIPYSFAYAVLAEAAPSVGEVDRG